MDVAKAKIQRQSLFMIVDQHLMLGITRGPVCLFFFVLLVCQCMTTFEETPYLRLQHLDVRTVHLDALTCCMGLRAT